jgi:hypothetical protein
MSRPARKSASEGRKAAPEPMGMIDIVTALDDPALFGPFFHGPSWDGWRAILKAAHALPMTERELELFRAVAERDPPKKRVRELWVAAGRRAGKDSIVSAMATVAALQPYTGLRPGEAPTVMCLAVDKQQARIVLRYIKGFFERIELLQGLVERETADGLELKTGAEIVIMPNNFRAARGRTVVFACLDECAFFRSDESANPAAETYGAITPGMATISGAMLAGISSVHRRDGLLYENFKAHYGKDDDDVLFIKATSRALNPTLDQRIVDAAMARDPAAARAEYLSEWRDDIASFLSRELIESAVDTDVLVRPPIPGVTYTAFADPSGGVGDSFTAAVCHAEGDVIILDCLVEIAAPFNPTAATASIAKTLKEYRLTDVVGDRYGAAWIVDACAKVGMQYRHSDKDRSAIYSDALPLFTAGRVRLLDNKKLVTQFANLERRTTSSGRDIIDHPAGQHDDLANSVAGALVRAAAKPKTVPFVAPIMFGLAASDAPHQDFGPTYAPGAAGAYADQRRSGFTLKRTSIYD